MLEQISELRQNPRGLDIVAAYLDDVVFTGNTEAVLQAFQIIQAASPNLGLELKNSKCELIPTTGHNSTADLSSFPQDMKRKLEGNFSLLGAPIGDESYSKAFLRGKRLHTASTRLLALKDLGDAHAAYKILSMCLGSCKLMYAMRTTRSDWVREVCAEYDALVKETTESILGVALPNMAWKQVCLSASAGGLGLRSSKDHRSGSLRG